MTHEVSATEIDAFYKKLQDFTETLSGSERAIFKSILEGNTLSDQDLSRATGGVGISFRLAPTLDVSFLRSAFKLTMPCW